MGEQLAAPNSDDTRHGRGGRPIPDGTLGYVGHSPHERETALTQTLQRVHRTRDRAATPDGQAELQEGRGDTWYVSGPLVRAVLTVPVNPLEPTPVVALKLTPPPGLELREWHLENPDLMCICELHHDEPQDSERPVRPRLTGVRTSTRAIIRGADRDRRPEATMFAFVNMGVSTAGRYRLEFSLWMKHVDDTAPLRPAQVVLLARVMSQPFTGTLLWPARAHRDANRVVSLPSRASAALGEERIGKAQRAHPTRSCPQLCGRKAEVRPR